MSYISDYLEDRLINHVFRNTPYNAPGAVYLALYSSDPGDDNSGSELAGSGYSRQVFTVNEPNNGIAFNGSDIIFDTATSDWSTVTHVGIFDALTGGNLLFYGPLSSAVIVTSGNNFRIPAGNLGIGFD